MTWSPALETEHPSGRKRDVVLATCDVLDCGSWDAVGQHGGDTDKVQKLLHRRGWVATDERDLCPKHRDGGEVS